MKKMIVLMMLVSLNSYALKPSVAAVDKIWQSVVMLKIPGPDSDGDIVDGFCVGTLVNAGTIVTAAHCIAGSTLNSNGQIKIEVGEYRTRTRPDGTSYSLGYIKILDHHTNVSVRFSSGTSFNSPANRISPENDFAFVYLTVPLSLPADFIFANIWNRSIENVSLMNPTLVSVNPIEYISTNDTKQMATLNQIKFSRGSAQSTSTSRVAPGDSGSPLFATINGRLYLIGVTKGLATTFFSNYDVIAIWGERAP